MEFTGTVIEFIDKAGTYKNGDKAGQPFKAAQIVVQDSETSQYPEAAVFELFGERVDYPSVGDKVVVEFNLKANEFNGKWYNKLNAWRIGVISAATVSTQTTCDHDASMLDPLADTGDGGSDDLPF